MDILLSSSASAIFEISLPSSLYWRALFQMKLISSSKAFQLLNSETPVGLSRPLMPLTAFCTPFRDTGCRIT